MHRWTFCFQARSGYAFARQLPPMQCDRLLLASGCGAPHHRSPRDRRAARLFCLIDIPSAALLPVARCSVLLLLRSGECRCRSLGRRAGDRTLRAPGTGCHDGRKESFFACGTFQSRSPRAVVPGGALARLPRHCPSPRYSSLSRPRFGRHLWRPLFLAAAPPGGSAVRLVPRRSSVCFGCASHPAGACIRTAGPTRLDTSAASAGGPAFRAYHLRPADAGLGDGLPAGSRASGSRLIAQGSRDNSSVRGAPVRRRNSQGYAPASLHPCSFFSVPLLRPAVSRGLRRPRLLATPVLFGAGGCIRSASLSFQPPVSSRRLSQNKARPRR